jgi:hypothetical protein
VARNLPRTFKGALTGACKELVRIQWSKKSPDEQVRLRVHYKERRTKTATAQIKTKRIVTRVETERHD